MTQPVQVDALVLAGGDGDVVDHNVAIKGLVPVLGRPMVEWVVDALRAAKTVRKIAVVVPTSEGLGDWTSKVDELVICDGQFSDNALAGVQALKSELHIVGLSADIPAVTPEAIDDFVVRTLDIGADFSYALIRKQDMLAQFPGSVRTFIKIKDGSITGGNVMVISSDISSRVKEIFQEFFDTRKNPVKMARVVGVPFVVKLVSGNLDPDDVGRKLEQVLKAPCAAVFTTHACIGADVDKPIDVEVVERALLHTQNTNVEVV